MKPNRNLIMCPDCGKPKIQFETEKEAERFIQYNGEEISETPENLRVYYCPSCCCYHVSSKKYTPKYEKRTEKLINAFYEDRESSAKKSEAIRNIREIVELEPTIKIDRTGSKRIETFVIVNDVIKGVDQNCNTFNLYVCTKDELERMLVKLMKKHYKL